MFQWSPSMPEDEIECSTASENALRTKRNQESRYASAPAATYATVVVGCRPRRRRSPSRVLLAVEHRDYTTDPARPSPLVDLKCSHSARVTVAILAHREVTPDAPCSRDPLDRSYGIFRISPDRPGAADFQRPLNYRSIAGSFNRFFARYHVHSPRAAATKTCRSYISDGTNLPELGQVPRKRQLTSKVKGLIETGRLYSGCSCSIGSA